MSVKGLDPSSHTFSGQDDMPIRILPQRPEGTL